MLTKFIKGLRRDAFIRFLRDRRGTPSIETVLIIALIALAIAPMLQDLGNTLGGVMSTLGNTLEQAVGMTAG